MTDLGFLDRTFADDTRLRGAIKAHLVKSPESLKLFKDIASYIDNTRQPKRTNGEIKSEDQEGTGEHLAKRPKIEDPTTETKTAPEEPVLTVREISFTLPTRKKYTLVLRQSSIEAVSALNHDEVIHSIELHRIRAVFALPLPEKSVPSHSFCIFPHGSEGLGPGEAEPFVFTAPETAPNTASGSLVAAVSDPARLVSYTSVMVYALNEMLKAYGRQVVLPDPGEFQSVHAQPNKKSQKAFHVQAHRGSKEGYLYFSSEGFVFGFKRPLLFVPINEIRSVSYSNVLQRTFNLTIVDHRDQQVELSMIDQGDFNGIDTFIRRHKLNDASMAAERAAKTMFKGKPGEANELAKAAAFAAAARQEQEADGPGSSDDEEEDATFQYDRAMSDGGSPGSTSSEESDQGEQEETAEEEQEPYDSDPQQFIAGDDAGNTDVAVEEAAEGDDDAHIADDTDTKAPQFDW